jgi:hypothetical protein
MTMTDGGLILPNKVFEAQEGSQSLALSSPCDHTLYHGTRGPGKTITQIMDFRRFVGVGYGPAWRGVIFDMEFKNLGDILKKTEEWFPRFNDGAVFLRSASEYRWKWPTGEQLLLRTASKDTDYWGYHGQEYAWIGWNELTKYPSPFLYDSMMSTNRSSFVPEENPVTIDGDVLRDTGKIVICSSKSKAARPYILPRLPLRVFSTTNPFGPGHAWVKRRFIDGAQPGQVKKQEIEIPDRENEGGTKIVTKTQVAIFGSYIENRFLDDTYIAELAAMTDPVKKEAWLMGSWDIVAGGAIDDLWRSQTHVVPRFVVPKSWYVDRTYDDGSTHPFAVSWFAEADGTEALIEMPDGEVRSFCPEPGSIIMFNEWYGGKAVGTNEGLKMGSMAIAKGIKERESALMFSKWLKRQPKPGPADNRIRNVIDKDLDTTETLMAKQGIKWTKSDKSSGSRVMGLAILRDYLERSLDGEGPGFYVMNHCVATIALLPSLARCSKNPDDVDTNSDDHMYDTIRYRLLNGRKREFKPSIREY